MYTNGMFNAQRIAELKVYVRLLEDDSVMPKGKLEDAIKYMEEEQQKIAMIDAQAQLMKQRANQFLMEDPEAQASQVVAAEEQIANEVPTEEVEEEMVEEVPVEE